MNQQKQDGAKSRSASKRKPGYPTAPGPTAASLLHEPQAAYQAHQAIQAGFPIQSAIDLEDALDLTNKETAELLGISPSTLARRKAK